MATASLNRTDQELQQDVLAELKWDAQIQPNEIGVSVRDGVVSDAGSRFCRTAVAYEMHFPIPNASE